MPLPVIITSIRTAPMRKSVAAQIRKDIGEGEIPLRQISAIYREHRIKPQVMKTAQDILRGRVPQEWVEECEQGFKIKHPILIELLRKDVVEEEELRDLARLTLMSDLTQLGHRVALLTPDPRVYELTNPHALDQAQAAGIAPEDIIPLHTEEKDDYAVKIAFPRDLFVQLGNTVYFSPEDAGPYELEKFFRWGNGLKRNYSRIGCGGGNALSPMDLHSYPSNICQT